MLSVAWYALAVAWAAGAATLFVGLGDDPARHGRNRALVLLALGIFLLGIVIIPLARTASVFAGVAGAEPAERSILIAKGISEWMSCFVYALPSNLGLIALAMWVYRRFSPRSEDTEAEPPPADDATDR